MTPLDDFAPGDPKHVTHMAAWMAMLGRSFPVRGAVLLGDGVNSCAQFFGYLPGRDEDALKLTDLATAVMAVGKSAGVDIRVSINGHELLPTPEEVEVTSPGEAAAAW